MSTTLLDLDESLAASYWTDAQSVLPATALACTAQGWASPTALWMCDESSGNLVDEIGSVALVPTSSPLQGRSFNGIKWGGSLAGKVGVETIGGGAAKFQASTGTPLDITTEDFTFSVLIRTKTILVGVFESLFDKYTSGGNGYEWYLDASGMALMIRDSTGGSTLTLGSVPYDGACHLATISVDRNGNALGFVDDAATVTVAAARTGTLTCAAKFTLNGYNAAGNYSLNGQTAWAYACVGTACSRDAHDALYAGLFPWRVEYATHTRNGRVVVPVSATASATFASGRPAHSFDAATGLVGLTTVQPVSFLGLKTNNLPAWSVYGATLAAVDGVSGLRDGIRVTMTGNWDLAVGRCAYTPSPYATVAAPSNDNYVFGGWVKTGTVGTTGRVAIAIYTGGTAETFTLYSSDSVPATWTYVSGTFTASNSGNTKAYLMFGAKLNTQNCDFCDWFVCKGTAAVPPGYILVALGAAESMAAQAVTVTNDGTKLYAARGVVTATLQNLNSVTGKHVALWAESTQASPYIEMGCSGADIYITIRDSGRNLVATVTATSAITATKHSVVWLWDSARPVSGSNYIAIRVDGSEVAAGQTSSWTPPADSAITPIGVGGGNSANALHGAFSEIKIDDPLTSGGTLAGSCDGISSVSAVLGKAVSLVGSGEGDASLSRVLGEAVSLAGSGEGDVTLSSVLGYTVALIGSGEGDATVSSVLGLAATLDACGAGDAALQALLACTATLDASGAGDASLAEHIWTIETILLGVLSACGEGTATLIKVPSYTPRTTVDVSASATTATVTPANSRTVAIVEEV